MFSVKNYFQTLFILILKDFTMGQPNQVILKNIYGDDYGTTWIFFPDGEGNLHYVNLTISKEESMIHDRAMMNNQMDYRLYIRNNTKVYFILDEMGKAIDDIDLKTILSNKPLKIITHGWISTADSKDVVNLKNAYLEAKDVNVIVVDWSSVANSVFYHWVANEIKNVGARIASFLSIIYDKYNVSSEQMHLIGHSLGAHVMGVAASMANFTVDRITGLDPARPLFEYPMQDLTVKLDSTDAKFVDVLHTCSGVLGFEAAIGTVDFFPNNGVAPQPGCDTLDKIIEACSHGRSWLYFEESIRDPKAFPAFQCQSWVDFLSNKCDRYSYMGESVSRNVTGRFYLKTNSFHPFGLRS